MINIQHVFLGLVAAASNAQTANSSVIVGVLDDPGFRKALTTLFRFIVGCAAGAGSV
jgi:hypothetical protein